MFKSAQFSDRLLVLAIVIGLLMIFLRLSTVHVVWVGAEEANPEDAMEAELLGGRKVHLGERLVGSYLTLGLPRHYLTLKFWGIIREMILLVEEESKAQEINFSDPFACQDPDGREVVLRFYKEKPTARPPWTEEGQGAPGDEGPLWEEGEERPRRGPLWDI